ncbi:hypothetical protein A7G45_01925 [Mycolicibacterium llatzerense]|nr:hypothetical protein [Mycolicibacterium llatzerense]
MLRNNNNVLVCPLVCGRAVAIIGFSSALREVGAAMDPVPDYDASDEVEYFFTWLPWALRGVYPPPAYPPV